MSPEKIDNTQVSRKKSLIIQLHTFVDICMTVVSFVSAYFIKKYLLPYPYGGLTESPNYYIVLLTIIIIWYIVFRFFEVYWVYFDFNKDFRHILWNVIKSVSIGIIVLITTLYVLKIENISRILIGIFYIINLILTLFSHLVVFKIWKSLRQNEHYIYNIIIIGSKKRAKNLIRNIHLSQSDVKILGCLEAEESMVGIEVEKDVEVIGTIQDLKDILLNQVVDEIVFAMPLRHIETVDSYLVLIELIGVKVRIIPEWHIQAMVYQPNIATMMFDNFCGIPTMLLSPTSSKHRDLLVKNMFDIAISGIILLLSSPLFIMIMLLIKISSKGPVFFKQERLGLNGRKFSCYKFRTMVKDAEAKLKELQALNEADGPAFKIKKDPRIIPFIGTILRKTSLDELPQLINVFKGEMSLVGPRPPIPDEVKQYDVWQRRRLSMKPGITCLWQIAPKRNDLSFSQWMELDLKYIDNWSLKLDFFILLKTFRVVVGAEGR